MNDEKYEFFQDCKDKKITARSARHTRTHNGKGGAVKFPSDYLSKKELKAMNGPCESYRMNDPMTWDQFKRLSDDLKVTYVKALREKYNVPDTALAEAMGANPQTFSKYLRCYGLGQGKGSGAAGRHWYHTHDHDQFIAWWNGVKLETVTETEQTEVVEEAVDIPENNSSAPVSEPTERECCGETRCVAPMNGYMTFEGHIDDILRTVGKLLDGQNVHLKIEWDLMEE